MKEKVTTAKSEILSFIAQRYGIEIVKCIKNSTIHSLAVAIVVHQDREANIGALEEIVSRMYHSAFNQQKVVDILNATWEREREKRKLK